jgi:hypothetical protein
VQIFFLSALASKESSGAILKELLKRKDDTVLIRTLTDISHIANSGGVPRPPRAKLLRGIGDNELCEIRTKYDRDNLLRIYYFVDKERSNLILLNAIIKPDGGQSSSHYEGGAGRRLRKDINNSVQLAIELKELYSASNNDYEPLKELFNL